MRISGAGPDVSYTCLRRWPGPRDATSQVRISVGDRFGAGDLDERDHFLTARWILFSVAGARYRYTKALWITGLADRLPMYDSVADALAPAGDNPAGGDDTSDNTGSDDL